MGRVILAVRSFDARIWTIVATVTCMIVVTVGVYILAYGFHIEYFEKWKKPESHVGAVFASWVGGLVLFVIAGAFVAIVSLERPEKSPFEARARILCGFRRKSATDSDLKSATDSAAKPATRSGAIRPPIPI